MSKERELLKQAIYFLEPLDWEDNVQDTCQNLINEIKELLAQPESEQEPVAWMYERQAGDFTARTLSVGFEENFDGITTPLYTSPPTRKPLSDDEMDNLYYIAAQHYKHTAIKQFGRLIEKAHGIGE